jgi:hypothetical protein
MNKLIALGSRGLVLFFVVFMTSCYYDEVIPADKKINPDIVDEISFSKDIIPIFNASCNSAGCHKAGAIPPDLTPANAYTALNSGGYINTASPETSELYLWMKGSKSTPMPLSGPNVTYNAKVLAWIKQGAKNN